ncbi:MAG TPA: DUF5522 domain-containing protein, partial [Pyrinomonadaceae bacterium]
AGADGQGGRTVQFLAGMNVEPNRQPLVEGEDFYWEGAALVFTASFLLRRGYCCRNGCRHCPYEFEKEERGDDVVEKSETR